MLQIRIMAEGWIEAAAKMRRLPDAQRQAMTKKLNVFLLSVLRDSKEKPPRVPVDTGNLQASGFTEPAKIEGKNVMAAIGYGGVLGVDYAVYVHDNLNNRIKNYKRPGSGPKFLSVHFDSRRPELKEAMEYALVIGKEEIFP